MKDSRCREPKNGTSVAIETEFQRYADDVLEQENRVESQKDL